MSFAVPIFSLLTGKLNIFESSSIWFICSISEEDGLVLVVTATLFDVAVVSEAVTLASG